MIRNTKNITFGLRRPRLKSLQRVERNQALMSNNLSQLIAHRSSLSHLHPTAAAASAKDSHSDSRSFLALGFAACALLASPLLLSSLSPPSECCGIVGVVASPQKRSTGFTAREYLIEGLTVLKNRGYDSAGVATVGSTNEKVRQTTKQFV